MNSLLKNLNNFYNYIGIEDRFFQIGISVLFLLFILLTILLIIKRLYIDGRMKKENIKIKNNIDKILLDSISKKEK